MQFSVLQDPQCPIVLSDSHLGVILKARHLENLVRQELQVVHEVWSEKRLLNRDQADAIRCTYHCLEAAKESDDCRDILSCWLWRQELIKIWQKQSKYSIIVLLGQVILDVLA